MLAQTEKRSGARGTGKKVESQPSIPLPPTLAEMGITASQSSRWQQLAAMPAEHFETAVEAAKHTAGEVATTFMLRSKRVR